MAKHQLPNSRRQNQQPVNYDYLFTGHGKHVTGEGNRRQRRSNYVKPESLEKHEHEHEIVGASEIVA